MAWNNKNPCLHVLVCITVTQNNIIDVWPWRWMSVCSKTAIQFQQLQLLVECYSVPQSLTCLYLTATAIYIISSSSYYKKYQLNINQVSHYHIAVLKRTDLAVPGIQTGHLQSGQYEKQKNQVQILKVTFLIRLTLGFHM